MFVLSSVIMVMEICVKIEAENLKKKKIKKKINPETKQRRDSSSK